MADLAFIPPMLPTLVSEPPEGSDWIHEIKYDSWRTQIVVENSKARVFTRNGHDWTQQFAPVAAAALMLGHDRLILDGEMIVDGPDGKSDYQALRRLVKTTPAAMRFVAFDILHLDGHDVRGMALDERRHLLFSESFDGTGTEFFGAVERMGWRAWSRSRRTVLTSAAERARGRRSRNLPKRPMTLSACSGRLDSQRWC